MHLLLCNDDGYQAQGIQVLAQELKNLGHRITIVAPSGERSGQSHAMSFHVPVRVKKINQETYCVDGTPADCASIGLRKILCNDKPDFVVSGINLGLNVGTDVNYSGTVGAATEAALMGYKAIAVSLDTDSLAPSAPDQKLEALIKAARLVGNVLEH
ncbi:MAG: 5'/3'-nucleotidase SurE, partial [Silvanigrellaceae bacterium]|nr:5'/3'-nucleotidase SurE [Silvanigrellaceae bacterium]